MNEQIPGGPAATDHGGFDQIAGHQAHKYSHPVERDLVGAAVGAGVFFLLRAGLRRHPHITAWLVLLTVVGLLAILIAGMNSNTV